MRVALMSLNGLHQKVRVTRFGYNGVAFKIEHVGRGLKHGEVAKPICFL
jgi:hypothetical protein